GFGEPRGPLERDVPKVSRTVVLEQIASRRDAVPAGDHPPPDKQIEMAVSVEVAYGHAPAALREPREGTRIAVEVSVAVVDVQPVLERIVISPELVATAHDVQIRMPVAVGIEEHRVDVLGQAVRLKGPLLAGAEGPVALLEVEPPGLPFGAAHVDVIQPVAVDVADGQGWTVP